MKYNHHGPGATGNLLLSFALCFCLLLPAFADDAVNSAVLGVQGRYAGVDSVSADFQQNYRGPGIDQTESGHLWMKKPGLMRWEYSAPEYKLFVADGRETFLYTPADRQVLVTSFSAEDMRNTPLHFLLGQGEILTAFSASWEKEFRPRFEGTLCLRLVPRVGDSEYAFLVLEYDSVSFDLRRLIMRESTGNTSEFLFTNTSTVKKLDKKQFQFRVPKGVDVVRLDEK